MASNFDDCATNLINCIHRILIESFRSFVLGEYSFRIGRIKFSTERAYDQNVQFPAPQTDYGGASASHPGVAGERGPGSNPRRQARARGRRPQREQVGISEPSDDVIVVR